MSKNVLHRIGQPISYSQYFTSRVSVQDYTASVCRVHTALCHMMVETQMQCCLVFQNIQLYKLQTSKTGIEYSS
jgi:hypothetical protein